MPSSSRLSGVVCLVAAFLVGRGPVSAFVPAAGPAALARSAPAGNVQVRSCSGAAQREVSAWRLASAVEDAVATDEATDERIVTIRPQARQHIRRLRESQGGAELVLRMGVRSGGCSGLSYVMDLMKKEEITEDDMVEEYPEEGFTCAIDPKSVLYLYGLQLDYSDALIGGGFQFHNPNAETSCGCGKSFGV